MTMKNFLNNKKFYIFAGVISLILLWQIGAMIINSPLVLPSPWQTLKALPEVLTSALFYKRAGATLLRVVYGFLIVIIAGAALAVISTRDRAENVIKPFMSVMRSIPTLVLTVLFLSWFASDTAPVVIGVMMVLPVSYMSFLNSIKSVDKKLVEMARIYKISSVNIVKDIYLPFSLKAFFPLVSNAFGMTLKVIISAEVLVLPVLSLGRAVFFEQTQLQIPNVFAYVLIILAVTFLFDLIVNLVEKAVIKW